MCSAELFNSPKILWLLIIYEFWLIVNYGGASGAGNDRAITTSESNGGKQDWVSAKDIERSTWFSLMLHNPSKNNATGCFFFYKNYMTWLVLAIVGILH